MSDDARNIAILHCECGATHTIKANTNSGVLLKAEESPWGCGENDIKAGGHCRGRCPPCREKDAQRI